MDNYSLLSSEEHVEMRQIAAGAEVQLFSNNRRDSRGSITGETRVQFALSQTPPVETTTNGEASTPPRHHAANTSTTATHHTLSPVIQCFQNDK